MYERVLGVLLTPPGALIATGKGLLALGGLNGAAWAAL